MNRAALALLVAVSLSVLAGCPPKMLYSGATATPCSAQVRLAR